MSDDIEWRYVPGFPQYLVSSTGLVKSIKIASKHKILRPIVRKETGHLYVFLYEERKRHKCYVHRIVAQAFLGAPPPDMVCRHLDGNPKNNTFSNLAWGTNQENSDDKWLHGTMPVGEKCVTHKLTEQDVLHIRQLHGQESLRALAKRFGVSHTSIRRAAIGMKWSYLKEGLN